MCFIFIFHSGKYTVGGSVNQVIKQETAEDGKAGLQSTDTNIIYGYLYIDTYIIYGYLHIYQAVSVAIAEILLEPEI